MSASELILVYKRQAWDRQVGRGNPYTMTVSHEEVARARKGNWSIALTPTKPIPTEWFPPLNGLEVHCLASGGGQQVPSLAAAGANVTTFENIFAQLAQDRVVAGRDGLGIETVHGDTANLRVFPDAGFDLIRHPVSKVFVPGVKPAAMWCR
jgi:hypothetical protein